MRTPRIRRLTPRMRSHQLGFKVQFIGTLFAMALHALGQGTITADNLNGTGNSQATSFGRFFDVHNDPYSATPINITILGGPDGNSLSSVVTLKGVNALIPVGGGIYVDPSGASYAVPGVVSGQPATLQVLAWRGSASSFAESGDLEQFWPFDGSYYRNPTTFTFRNPTGGPSAASLDGMPAMLMVLETPEPSAATLASLGAMTLWLLRRKPKAGDAV